MGKQRIPSELVSTEAVDAAYDDVLASVSGLLESARHAAARSVNSIMTATYWDVGRRIVDFEQAERNRAVYRARLVERLSADLTRRFGRGFGVVNLTQMQKFYQTWPKPEIVQTVSEELGRGDRALSLPRFPLTLPSVSVVGAYPARPILGPGPEPGGGGPGLTRPTRRAGPARPR